MERISGLKYTITRGVVAVWLAAAGSPAFSAEDEVWPGTREGLIWIWENGASRNQAPPQAGEDESVPCLGRFQGRSRLGPNFEQLLDGGSFLATAEAGRRIVAACRDTEALSFEAVLTSFQASVPETARVLTIGDLVLGQSGAKLRLSRGEAAFELAQLEPGRPIHVLVSQEPGLTRCWLNGREVFSSNDLGWNAGAPDLILGGDWPGSIEAVAIFNRFIGAKEARIHRQLLAPRLETREPIPVTAVEAKFVQITPTPPVEALESYRRALVENIFEIRDILSGPKIEAKRIVVLQWAILDRQPLGPDPKPGSVARLRLEPAHLHPELRGEFRVRDHAEFDVPVFLDVDSHLR